MNDRFVIARATWYDDEPWWHWSTEFALGPMTRWQAIWYLLRTDLGGRR